MKGDVPFCFGLLFTNGLSVFWIYRHSLYHRLCNGRAWEVGSEISCGSEVISYVFYKLFSWHKQFKSVYAWAALLSLFIVLIHQFLTPFHFFYWFVLSFCNSWCICILHVQRTLLTTKIEKDIPIEHWYFILFH